MGSAGLPVPQQEGSAHGQWLASCSHMTQPALAFSKHPKVSSNVLSGGAATNALQACFSNQVSLDTLRAQCMPLGICSLRRQGWCCWLQRSQGLPSLPPPPTPNLKAVAAEQKMCQRVGRVQLDGPFDVASEGEATVDLFLQRDVVCQCAFGHGKPAVRQRAAWCEEDGLLSQRDGFLQAGLGVSRTDPVIYLPGTAFTSAQPGHWPCGRSGLPAHGRRVRGRGATGPPPIAPAGSCS